MNWIAALGLGVVGGYAYCRAKEAKANGVPLDRALKEWRVPIVNLKLEMVMEDEPQPKQRRIAPVPGR